MTTLHALQLPVQSNKDHRALVRAILAGDGARAAAIHRRHRERAMATHTHILESLGTAGV